MSNKTNGVRGTPPGMGSKSMENAASKTRGAPALQPRNPAQGIQRRATGNGIKRRSSGNGARKI